MKLTNSAVPVYTVAGSETGKNLPELLSQRKRKKTSEYANRVELLQDFEFEEASQCVRVSDDGEWVMSTGTYKPQIHTHCLPNLSLSWARHTNTLNKTFLFLSSDYSKSVHLQEDRSIEFHTPGGCHYSIRIPRYGRDLAYDKSSADLLIPTVGVNANGMGEVFRVNLEIGRFMNEFEVDVGGDDMTSAGGGALQGGINVGSVNTAALAQDSHNLYAFGTSLGTVEFWDPRVRTRVGSLVLPQDFEGRPEVTAMSFHRSGIINAVGTSSGLVYLYDLRSSTPTLKKDQGYGYPIKHVEFLTPTASNKLAASEPKVLSADRRILKIWDQLDGTPWTSVEPAVDINCVAWCKDSGMILTANEGKQQHAFLIPQLGPAPRWCAFLDNVVEEMADNPNDPHSFATRRAGEVYDNYKFLTLPQLRTLNLDHLISKTNLLRPYMHGYFVAQRLYEEARLIANPSSWEEERAKRVQAKIDQERESRVRGKKKIAVKVNRKMMEKILDREEKNERRRAQRVLAQADNDQQAATKTTDGQLEQKGLLADSRFARLFQDEEFAVDETSREFQQLNPSTKAVPASNLDHERGLTAVEEELIDEVPRSSDESGSDDDAHALARSNGTTEHFSSTDYRRQAVKKNKQGGREKQMRMTSSSGSRGAATAMMQDQSFGSRAVKLKSVGRSGKQARNDVYGDQTITFEPRGGKKKPPAAFDSERKRDGRGSKERRSASGNTLRRL